MHAPDEPSIEGVAPDRSFATLRSMARQHWGRVTLATLVRAAASALPALHPYFLAQLATSAGDPDQARRYLILLFASGAGHFVLWSACDYYISARIVPLSYEFKRAAFDTVWSADYQRFVDRPSGKVASYVNDLRNHAIFLWEAIHFGFLPMVAAIPVYVVLLWQTAPGNALAYGIFLIGAGLVLSVVARPVHASQRHLTDTTATNTGRVFDSYANFVNVFSFRAQHKEIARNDTQLDGLIDDDVRFSIALSSYWATASALIRVVLWAGVMAFSWWQFDQGRISFTAMVVSITVLLDFTSQYWNVVHNFGEWIDKSAAFREAYNYLFPGRNIIADPPPDPAPVEGRKHLRNELEVRDLSFAYPDE
ncbi:MAG: ABC transporter transmembrane domain-containing protein, partial [Actinomycetota bacterium]